MTTRAEKSGFAAEAQAKIHSKFDSATAGQVLDWIKTISGQDIDTSGDFDNFVGTLKDGVVLCNLANALQPGAVKNIKKTKMPFMQMENINFFLGFVDKAGVPKNESFQTVDLYEATDPNSVLVCLMSLARKADKFGKPAIGPKESSKQERQWSEEKLRAGEGVIGLQMGSNKGATQAGMNIGKTRHIVD